MEMEVDQIEMTLVLTRAQSLDEFRSEKTELRILGKPFFRMIQGGGLVFDFISNETDAAELKAFIEQGLIYVIKE